MLSTNRTSRWFSSFLAFALVFSTIASLAIRPITGNAAAVNLVVNPGFENEASVWTDWNYAGTASSLSMASGNGNIHTGAKSISYYNASAFQVAFSQTITGLTDGEYVLKAWASGDGGEPTINVFADNYGGSKLTTAVTNNGWNNWHQYTVSGIQVVGGQARIGFEVSASGKWGVFDDFEFYKVEHEPTWSASKSVSATAHSPTSLSLDWSGVNDVANVNGYNVYQDGQLIGSTAETTFDVDDLTPETQYTFSVQASNAASLLSLDGPSTTVTTAVATAEAPVWGGDAALHANQLTSRGVVLDWPAATDNVGVTKYRIYQNGQVKTTVSGTVYSYYATDLKPGTSYTFKVEAGDDSALWSTGGPTAAVTTPPTPADDFVKGADVSTLPAIEDAGGKYYDNGVEKGLLAILKDHGVNYVRLRIWNDPVQAGGYNDKAHTVAMAKRVKDAGLKLLLDFHYSDFWADPGAQVKPAAWASLTFPQLNDAMYAYTAEVLNEMKAEGAYPDMVQIGNEINPGMMLPDGSTSNYDKLAQLLSTGIKAVHDTTPAGHEVKTMIHLAEGGNNGLFRGYFDALTSRNVDFDVIGLSFYPYWHGTYKNLKDNLNDLATRYGKQLIVAETAHPYTLEDGDGWGNIAKAADAEAAGFPATVQGQYDQFTMMLNTVAHTTGGKGAGVFYWEPAWIPVPKDTDGNYQAGWKINEGNAWDNQAMFDFHGNALPSLDAYRFDASHLPAKAAVKAIDPDGITVSANVPANDLATLLPSTAGVLFNEGSIDQTPVVWETADQDRLSRIGTFALNGTLTGTSLTVQIKITVTSYRNLATNPGFEAASTLTGWTVTGTTGAAKVDGSAGNAFSGSRSLNYWNATDYAFTISQTITGLADGTYTLKAKAAGGGGETTLKLYAEGYGGDKLTSAPIVNTGWNVWGTYTIEHIHVTNGQAVIGIEVAAPGEKWGNFDDIEFFREVSVPTWTQQASLTASEQSTSGLKLNWSGVSEEVAATGYKVYQNGVLLTTVTGTSYTVAGLQPNTSYTFKVEASADSSIWTSDGPSVTATTLPTSTTGQTTPPITGGKVTIYAEELLANGSGSDHRTDIKVPTGTTEIRLPSDTAQLLGGNTLALNFGAITVDVPAELLADLTKQAGAGGGYIAVKAVPHNDSADLIARAANASDSSITLVGTVYDFGLVYVSPDGHSTNLTTFDKPVTLRFATGTGFDPERSGVYYISDDGKLEYIGGRYENGILIAQATHFSTYAVLQVSRTFADVPANHWAAKAIASLASKLIVNGTGNESFEPERAVTRAEFATMLARALKLPKAQADAPFKDVTTSASYAQAVSSAYAAGIVLGSGDGTIFAPNKTITRQEMAVMLLRAYEFQNPEAKQTSDTAAKLPFADQSLIAEWALPAIERAVDLALLKGRDGNKFAPLATLTRAEAAQAIVTLLARG
ncbi:glycosyl hydrolase 53 family protein [Cohnella yongneupensis]|uniref:Arabinogalactan endo-beta-1,4-galactanase n=1 Tax=Cohnella yongneupensis TaxID=425006 RepID=A0ABW0QY93_9BACL